MKKAATPALSKKIESTISFANVLQLNIQDELSDVQWLEEADFEVKYNARGILVITMWMSGSGAYPDGTSKAIVVDLRTGSRITAARAFTGLRRLAEIINAKQKLEIEAAVKEIREDPDEKEMDPSELFGDKNFTAENIDEFEISDGGVTFIYDYAFPHVIKALEPEGRYYLAWSEIADHVRPNGPLAKFVTK